jgi:hypothetical protein
MVLLGVGAVWVGKHAPVPSNKPTASELARDRRLERINRAIGRRLRIRARHARRLERARRLWARRANKICGSANRADRASLVRLMRAKSPTEVVGIVSRVEVEGRRVLNELEALPPQPGRTAARVRRMLSLYEQTYALDVAATAALRRGDRAGFIRAVRRELPLGERGDAIARDLGADVCGEDFADSG